MVNLRSGILYIMKLIHVMLKVLFVFDVAFYFLFGCRFLLIKGTGRTGIDHGGPLSQSIEFGFYFLGVVGIHLDF